MPQGCGILRIRPDSPGSPGPGPVPGAVATAVTGTMWQCAGPEDAPVNNLMVRSQSACSFQAPGIADSR